VHRHARKHCILLHYTIDTLPDAKLHLPTTFLAVSLSLRVLSNSFTGKSAGCPALQGEVGSHG
jgi:hypothetical protein